MSTEYTTPAPKDGTTIGERIRLYLEEHPESVESLDQLAAQFFISKFYLCRAFRRATGTSPHQYLLTRRVTAARALIDGGMTASEAAYRVGFGDYSAFYRAYVSRFGHAPTADEGKETV